MEAVERGSFCQLRFAAPAQYPVLASVLALWSHRHAFIWAVLEGSSAEGLRGGSPGRGATVAHTFLDPLWSLALRRLCTQLCGGRGTGVWWSAEDKNEEDPEKTRPPCKASRPRVLTRGGGVSHFPLVETQLTPINTPQTATSSTHFLVSAQLTPNPCIHLIIQQTSPILGPQEASALAQFSRNTQSWERTELDIDTPSSMESEQG